MPKVPQRAALRGEAEVTPSGLLQKKDVIQNNVTGKMWQVYERIGNDALYAVRLRPLDGKYLQASDERRGYMIMTEAAYWLKNGYKFLGKGW